MASNISTLLTAGFYNTGPAWSLEFEMEYGLLLFVLDDEVLHRSTYTRDDHSAGGVAQIFLELLLVLMSSFPREKVLEEALEGYLAIDDKWELNKRHRIDKYLAPAARHPGAGKFVNCVQKSKLFKLKIDSHGQF